MADQDVRKLAIEIRAIDVSDLVLHIPRNSSEFPMEIQYSMTNKMEVNREKSLVVVETKVKVTMEKRQDIDCSIGILYTFSADGLSEVLDGGLGEKHLVDFLIKKLSPSITSTTRGIMYSALRGTALQNAILPLQDPHEEAIVTSDGSLIEESH